MRFTFRAVIECCGELFCKLLTSEYFQPEVGNRYIISLYPGQGWGVETFDKIDGGESDVTTFFFKSEDPELFECLCDCLTPEKGWKELTDGERFMIRGIGLGKI